MTPPEVHETTAWPQPAAAPLDRDPALALLEEAWRAGLLVENEPSTS